MTYYQNYRDKYIKYKSKYLNLINVVGGFNTKHNIDRYIDLFISNLEVNIATWVMFKNKIHVDTTNLLSHNRHKISKYYSHLFNIIDPTNNKYQSLIFFLFLNKLITIDFLYYKFYYYLNIFNIIDLTHNTVQTYTLETNKIKDRLKIDITRENIKIRELLENNQMIKEDKTSDKTQLLENHKIIHSILMDNYEYNHLFNCLHFYKLFNISTLLLSSSKLLSNTINYYVDNILDINLLDINNNFSDIHPFINLNTIIRDMNNYNPDNIMKQKVSDKLSLIYRKLDNINSELLILDESNYLDVNQYKTIATYFDLTQEQIDKILDDYTILSNDDDITPEKQQLILQPYIQSNAKDQQEFDEYYTQNIDYYSRSTDFNNLINIDKILVIFNFICRDFSKIKYLLFRYSGINNNEIYLNNNILIIKPKDMITSIFYGTSTTQWCTSAKYDNQFKNYFIEDIKNL